MKSYCKKGSIEFMRWWFPVLALESLLPFGDPWNDLEELADLVGKANVVGVVFLVGKWEWVCSSRFASGR